MMRAVRQLVSWLAEPSITPVIHTSRSGRRKCSCLGSQCPRDLNITGQRCFRESSAHTTGNWRTEGPAVKRRIAIEDILDYFDTRTEDCQGMSLVGRRTKVDRDV